MKTTTYQCDICRQSLPINELIPLHFEKDNELKRDSLKIKSMAITDANKHICHDCLFDFAKIAEEIIEK